MRMIGTPGSETWTWRRAEVWAWRYRRGNSLVLAGGVNGYNKRSHAILMAKLVTGWDGRDIKIPIVGPGGQNWADIDGGSDIVPASNGVAPGRRYRNLDRRRGRIAEVTGWDEGHGKWELRAVQDNGLGLRTYISSEGLRKRYAPV